MLVRTRDLAQVPSSDTPIVVMEPTEYGDRVDAAVCLERPSNRLLVPRAWCGRASCVEADVLGDDAPEVNCSLRMRTWFEHLSAERAGEAFSEGIHVRCAYRGAHDAHPRPSRIRPVNRAAELGIVVADDNPAGTRIPWLAFLACCAAPPRRSVAYVTAASEDRSGGAGSGRRARNILAEPDVEGLHEAHAHAHGFAGTSTRLCPSLWRSRAAHVPAESFAYRRGCLSLAARPTEPARRPTVGLRPAISRMSAHALSAAASRPP